jgi:tetratricopeptide (TPR) repeat protein
MRGISLRRIAIVSLLALVMIYAARLVWHTASVDADLTGAQQAMLAQDDSQAAMRLASAAKRLPWRADLWELAGHFALKSGDPQAAIEYLERAGQSQLSSHGQVELGDAYQQVGDLPNAMRLWEEDAHSAHPSQASLERLVQAYQSQDDYVSLIPVLSRLVELRPEDANLRYRQGLILAASQPEMALAHLRAAADLDPEQAPSVEKIYGSLQDALEAENRAYTLLLSGRALASIGEWELAAEAFSQATLSQPDYAEAWAYLGGALGHLASVSGNAKDSATPQQDGLAELQKALELDPDSLAAYTFLSMYWAWKGDFAAALQAIRSAIALDAENPALQVELGGVLALSGDLASAHQAYLRAIDLAPADPTYLRALAGFSLGQAYQVEEVGLPAARQAVILAPNDPANLDMLAQVMIRLGDLDSAGRFLNRALELEARYAAAHLHLGLLHVLKGETSAAYQELKRASALAPGTAIDEQSRRLLETYFP